MKSAVGIMMLGLFVAGGCTKSNPELCCTSPADCEAVQLPGIVDCEFGLRCEGNKCVRPNCTSDSECPEAQPACNAGLCYECDDSHACGAERPICFERTCVECDATTACAATNPVCDLETNACGGCTTETDCEAFPMTPRCNTESGSCAECTLNTECSGTKPICDGNACRACTLDSECETGACDEDGSCVAEDAIVWLDPAGTTNAECSRSMPCAWTLPMTDKVTATRRHIVMAPGLYDHGYVRFISSTLPAVTFIHGAGAVVAFTGTGVSPLLDATKALTLRNVSFGVGAVVSLRTSLFNFESVTFTNAETLRVSSGSLVARALKMSNLKEPLGAIQVDAAGDLTIDGGTIVGGTVGIVAINSGARFHLKNLMITRTSGRALELAQGQGELEFSTIAGSGVQTTSAPCAVSCSSLLTVRSSIIWQTSCNGVTQNAATSNCAYSSSFVANTPATAGFINVDPMFVNPAGFDFHIAATSPAKDAVDVGPTVDFEGNPRPQGLRYDIGADEAP